MYNKARNEKTTETDGAMDHIPHHTGGGTGHNHSDRIGGTFRKLLGWIVNWYKIRIDKKTGELVKPPRPNIDHNQQYWYRRPVPDSLYDDHYEYKKITPKKVSRHLKKYGWEFYK